MFGSILFKKKIILRSFVVFYLFCFFKKKGDVKVGICFLNKKLKNKYFYFNIRKLRKFFLGKVFWSRDVFFLFEKRLKTFVKFFLFDAGSLLNFSLDKATVGNLSFNSFIFTLDSLFLFFDFFGDSYVSSREKYIKIS